MTRRSFFRQMFSSIFVLMEELKGRRHFKLSDLPDLKKTQFLQLKIRIKDGIFIFKECGVVWADHGDGCERQLLYKENIIKGIVLDFVGENQTIEQILKRLSEKVGWEEERSYRYIRGFVLNLVNKGVCIPDSPIPIEDQ